MISKILDALFGCWHQHYSFPITVRNEARRSCVAAGPTGTYVVCLDCGREFPYDWKQMKVVTAPSFGRGVGAFVTKEAS
jgi:hypothetical protein